MVHLNAKHVSYGLNGEDKLKDYLSLFLPNAVTL